MMEPVKRIAAIHDLSGVGRCSLSVILPILSAMEVQVCAVPTAVLSAHTGGFGEVVFRDLTDFIPAALSHYRELGLSFDAVYSGFLGSQEQVDHCLDFFRAYPDALIVVDPVMGDHGKPYRTCTPQMRQRMTEMIGMADLITPNLTETSILLGESYPALPLTQSEAKSKLLRLSRMGPEYVLMTGVEMADGKISNIGYDGKRGAFWRVDCDYVPVAYPGTGDIFASVIVGSLLQGDSLPIAIERATRFLELAIRRTFSYDTEPRHGVLLESCLGWLKQEHSLKGYRLL